MVSVRYYTDPVCPWSWGVEPSVRKLMVEFGDALGWTFVMGGLARDLSKTRTDRTEAGLEQVYGRLIREWLVVADRTEMPLDPLLWVESPVKTSYPACMAVKAAAHRPPTAATRICGVFARGCSASVVGSTTSRRSWRSHGMPGGYKPHVSAAQINGSGYRWSLLPATERSESAVTRP
jgi:hypothetical protein